MRHRVRTRILILVLISKPPDAFPAIGHERSPSKLVVFPSDALLFGLGVVLVRKVNVAAARALVAGVARADLVQGIGDFHLALGVQDLGFEVRHGAALLLLALEALQTLFLGLILPVRGVGVLLAPDFEVALGAAFALVVHVFGVGLEGDFAAAAGAADVEAVDGDAEVALVGGFLASVEFAAFVDKFAA